MVSEENVDVWLDENDGTTYETGVYAGTLEEALVVETAVDEL